METPSAEPATGSRGLSLPTGQVPAPVFPSPTPAPSEAPPLPRWPRPYAWDDKAIAWNFAQFPEEWTIDGVSEVHPARRAAIFVVHGIGSQQWMETAGVLRSGFEDALEAIRAWQKTQPELKGKAGELYLPPPFVMEGYWGDYVDLQATFRDEWKRFNERERRLFGGLWKIRTTSWLRTSRWLLGQQIRLLEPRVISEVGLLAWLLYIPLQVVASAALVAALVRNRKIVSEVIADVRLYCQPRGEVERAIAQRIDYRVGAAFLQLIGLDWDFRQLQDHARLMAVGKPVQFERVVWVAHSLGTVISYNVLSDLFHRSRQLSVSGDHEQQEGVRRFRSALRRFITLGSPLDKVTYLFGTDSLRPWPKVPRSELLDGGEDQTEMSLRQVVMQRRPRRAPQAEGEDKAELRKDADREWWINFYHVLDPVSGALTSPEICGAQPPVNLHLQSSIVPGLAHLAYWRDLRCLRYILGRTYGAKYLRDKELNPLSSETKVVLALGAYIVWAVLLTGVAAGVLWFLVTQGPDVPRRAFEAVRAYFLGT